MIKWMFLFVVLLGALGAAGARYVWPRFQQKSPEWKAEKVSRGDIRCVVTSTGTVAPLRTVMVGAQISGKVKEVFKFPNDRVHAEELLCELDSELLKSEMRSAEVKLSQANAALSVLKVERENLALREKRQKAAVEKKKISVERARGTLDLAARNRERTEQLIAADAIAQTELEIRQLEEANAKRDKRLMEIELEQAAVDAEQIQADGRQLDAREEGALADIEQAVALLKRTKTNLGYCKIHSPIEGVVLQNQVEAGQTIAASFQTPNLFKIAWTLATVRIDAQIDEADVGRIRVDQDVAFEVDAYRGETFHGKVTEVRLHSETKGNLVTYLVLVEAKNAPDAERPHGKLLPGMTAGLRVEVDQRKNVLLLPSAALRFIPPPGAAPARPETGVETSGNAKDKKPGTRGTVFVAAGAGKLAPRAVQVGESDGDYFELLESDLKEGDEVVVGIKL